MSATTRRISQPDYRARYALKAAVRAVTEPLERRVLLSDNTTLATARDIDPIAIDLQNGAERLAVLDEPQDTGSYEYYRFTLAAGQVASISLAGVDDSLDLLNAGGTTLARGAESFGDLGNQIISDFVAPSAGTYFIRAYSDTAYDLYVTRGASIEDGSGTSLGAAQNITQAGQVLGLFDAASEIDFDGIDQAWLTENFDDAENFDWDIYYDGSIEHGTDDAFDGGLVRTGFPRFNYGQYEEDYEEIVLGPFQQGSLAIARKIYVPEDASLGFARFLEFVSNTSDSVVNHTLTIRTDLGSDLATQLVATSSGGPTPTVDDNWIVTDDADGSSDPAIVHVFAGSGGMRPSAVSLSVDELTFSYDLTLQPGETKVIMHLAGQSRSRASAIDKALRLASLQGGVMKGMNAGERAAIANFQSGGDSDFYRFNATAGDSLSITTQTLDSEVPPGQELDLLLELYDPAGVLVATNDNGAPDGRNAVISHTAGASGDYTVVVRSLVARRGEYSLAVQGATGTVTGPDVISTSVSQGQTLEAFPSFFRVNFSRSLRPGSGVAAALQINGIPASSVAVGTDYLDFSIPNAQSGNGAYAVTLAAGAATDLAGNLTQAFAMDFTVSGADLVVTNGSGPASATVGDSINISWTVANQGSRAATTGWYDYVYVSDDEFFGGADQFVFNVFNSVTLDPGANYSLQQTIPLPAAINAGARYLLFIADGALFQAESNDNNNVRAVPITVASPDLTLVAANAPATITVGQNFSVDWTVQNVSATVAAPVSSWFDYIYFSLDTTVGAGDVLLATNSRSNPTGFAPGESYTASKTLAASFSGMQLSGPGHLLFVANGGNNLGETSRTNNTLAVPVTLQAPDLTITGASGPPSAGFGELAPISWTVQNIGNVAASAVWFDQIYLSVDNTFNSGDFGITSSPSTAAIPLDPGETHTFNSSITIPSYLVGPGDYYLIVRANSFGIGETDRGNNDFAIPITLVAPDITVTAVTVPPVVVVDEDITVSWTVQNISDIAASADWYDAIYLSRDAILDDEIDEELDDRWAGNETPLAPGASYTVSQDVYIDPWDVAAGQWYLILAADAYRGQRETNEANNTFVIPIVVDAPDLVVSSATAPAVVDHNQSISLSWTVTNTSANATAQFSGDDYIVISDDQYFDWEDYWLDDFGPGSFYPLDPGESYTANMNVTIWPDVPAGQKYLLIIADGDEDAGEANERNNVRAIPITINGPDLSVMDFQAPAAAILGQPVQFSWTGQNSGLFAAQWSWLDGVFISDDPKYDPEKDTFVDRGFFGDTPLDPGEQYSLSPTFNIPTTALGDRYFLFVQNYADWQGETDLANNLVAVPVTIDAPDLSVSGATAPSSAVVGASIAVTWDVTNGALFAALGNWTDRVYLSSDPVFGGGDVQIGSFSRLNTLDPGATYTQSRNVTVPANTAPGSRYLIFLADSNNQQGETNENNNVFAVPILLDAPDLVVTQVTGAPEIAILGSSFDLTFTVQNDSAFNALQTSWTDSIYVSSDTLLDSSDTFVDRRGRSHSSLGAGASYTVVENITLPATAPGTRYLLVVTDRFDQGSSSNNNRQGESNENNNAFAVPIELIATDLTVTTSTSPASGAANQPIDISFTVRNQGTTPAPADWFDGVYLSTDNTFQASDTLLASISAADQSPLPAGASYSVSQQVLLPSVNAGNYFLLFVADRNNSQGETNETNNFRAQAISVTNPDLVPESLDAPDNASSGQVVEISWTVRNQSTSVAWADWYDSVYLSADSILGSNDTRIAADFAGAYSPLAAEGTYTITRDVSIPSGLTSGEYYLILSVDRIGVGPFDGPNNNRQRETTETNNELVVPITVGAPELVLTDTDAPAAASQDEEITLSWTVLNNGDGSTVTNWYDEVYLSTDGMLGDGDLLLAQHFDDSTILPGESYSPTLNAVIPAFPDGPAFLLFLVDRYNSQSESDETNNQASVPIQIGARDLVVSAVSGPGSASSGQSVNVTWTLTNNGSIPLSGTWSDTVYLSGDAIAGDDAFLQSFPITTSLAPGQTITRTQSVTLPPDAQGTYRFVVSTDSGAEIAEGNEANNSAVASDPIQIALTALPNLEVDQVSLAVSEAELGQPFTVNWTVVNTGEAATNSSFWRDYIFLSSDETLDETDLRIGDVQNPSFLNSGEGYTGSAAVRATAVSEGDYFILVKTDATQPDRVNETIEGDNVTAGPAIHITLPPPPDMVVASVQAPEVAFSGQPMLVSYRAVNNGPGRVNAGTWNDRIYLSTDEQLDATDLLLTQVTRTSSNSSSDDAPVDIDYTASYSPSLPVGMTGTFFVFVQTDATNRIDEFAFELNNSNHDATPVTINLTPPPDLEVESFLAPATASAGRAFAISYTVTNFGATATPNTSWSDAFFLSADNQFSADTDLRLGTQGNFFGAGLEPGDSYSRQRALATPVNLDAGDYYLFAVTDIDNVVFELDNANNVLSTPSLITISSEPADLEITSLSTPASATAGAGIAFSWTVTNNGSGDTIGASWFDRIYLSIDETIGNADDRELAHFAHSGKLNPGQQYSRSGTAQMPWDISGDVRLYLRTDTNGEVFEGAGESNNATSLRPLQVTRLASDLQLNNASLTELGGRLRFNWSVTNLGPGITGTANWYDGIYISADDVFGNSDDALLQHVFHGGRLSVDGGYSGSFLLDVPRSYSGLYHFFVAADSGVAVNEGGQRDNNALSAGTFDTSTLRINPDFVVTAVNAPAEATAGQAVSIAWTVRNTGDAIPREGPVPPELDNGSWRDNVYLSRDQIFDPTSDTFLGQWSTSRSQLGSIDEGGQTFQQYSRNIAFTMPPGQTGTFYVFVLADRNGEVSESNEANNTGSDLGGMFASLAPPADLTVGMVTIPTNNQVGASFSVEYTLENLGPNNAFGSWVDRLYLSTDELYSPDDVPLAVRNHYAWNEDGFIAAGTSETYTAGGRLNGVVPGDYYVVLRTDVYNAIPEASELNNVAASLASFSVEVPAIDIADGSGSANISTQLYNDSTQSFYFGIDTEDGQTVALDAVWNFIYMGQYNELFTGRNTQSSAYVALERIPSPFDYDFAEQDLLRSSAFNGIPARLVIPRTEAGTYYVRVDVRELDYPTYYDSTSGNVYTPGSVEDFDLVATVLPFTITQVSPGRAGNSGRATFEVVASDFDVCTEAQLLLDGQAVRSAENIHLDPEDPSRAFITFDLAGVAPGNYELRVLSEDGEADTEPVQITLGTGPHIGATADGPARVRFDRNYVFYVNYGNNGDADGYAPLLLVENLDGNPFSLSHEGLDDVAAQPRTMQLLGISRDGPAGILRSGATESIPLYFRTTGGTGNFRVSTITADDPRPLDFASIEAQLRPADVSDAEWILARENLMTLIGPTWGTYVRALAEVAGALAEGGWRTTNVTDLVRDLIREAREFAPTSIRGYVVPEGSCDPIAQAVVRAFDDEGSVFAARITPNGRYELTNLAPGTYTLVVDANGYERTWVQGVVVSGDRPVNRNLEMNTDATAGGAVILRPGGPADGILLVTARLRGQDLANEFAINSEESGEATAFTLPGLAAGTYDLTIRRTGYAPVQVTATVAADENLDLGSFELSPAGRVSGTVTGLSSAGLDIAIVSAYRDGELIVSGASDADGVFAIRDLAPGEYLLRVTNAPTGYPAEAAVTLDEGEQLTGVTLAIRPGAVLLGTVRDGAGQPLSNVQVLAFTPTGQNFAAVTGADGSYLINGVGLGVHRVMLAASSDADATLIDVTDLDGAQYTADVTFDAAATLHGLVTTADGTPLPGSVVSLISNGRVVASSRADTSGNYRFLLTEAGTFDLAIAADGASFANATGITLTDGETLERNLISGGGAIVVAATDGAIPAAGVIVQLFRLVGGGRVIAGSALTSPDGSARFANLAPGTYVADVINAATSRGASASVVLAPNGAENVNVALAALHEVSGTVTDSGGNPVRNARVLLLSRTDPSQKFLVATDAQGNYEVPAVPADTYDVVILADGKAAKIIQNVAVSGNTDADAMLLASNSAVTGRMVDASGQAIPNGTVEVRDVAGRLIGIAAVASDGTFQVHGVTGTGLTVLVQAPGFSGSLASGVNVADGATVSLGDLVQTSIGVGDTNDFIPAEDQNQSPFSVSNSALPSWLSSLFDALFGQFERRIGDEVSVDSIPDLPPGCTDCGPALYRALTFQSFQRIRAEIAESYDNALSQQKVITAALFVAELAAAAGTMAAIVIAVEPVVAWLMTLGSYGAMNAALASASGVVGTTATSVAAAPSALAIVLNLLQFYVSADKIATAITDAFTSTDAGTAKAALTQGQTAYTEMINIAQNIATLLPGLVQQIGGVATAYGVAGLWDSVKSLVESFSMTATNNAVDLYIEIEQNLNDAKADYNQSIVNAQQKRAAYLACIADSDGAGDCDCDGPDGPDNGDGGDDGNGADDATNPPAPPPSPSDPSPYDPQPVQSSDPNDIIGPEGFGEEGWIGARSILPYMIRFENQATASAPAQRVTITHQLDSDLDFRTFRVDDLGWGDLRIELPGNAGFHQSRVDLPDALGFDVDVTATIDIVTGLATWILQAVDPATGDAPADALVGFLPPNDADGSGEGFVTYTIKAKRDIATATRIDARATIIFDTNEPIDTPPIFNTLDTGAPQSSVGPLPPESEESFLVSWAGTDEDGGSGVASFDIYVSTNGGAFSLWLGGTELSEALFDGVPGFSYAFYSVARDFAGNTQTPPAVADAQTTVAGSSQIVVNAGGNESLSEGAGLGRSVSFTDPAASGPWTITIDYGDGSDVQTLVTDSSSDFLLSHIYADDGSYSVNVSIENAGGLLGSAGFLAIVENAAPAVDAGADQAAGEGAAVAFGGSFTDAGSADTHTLAWDFGDGATASGTLTPVHAYADDGTYTVTLTVTDDDGASSASTMQVNVSNVAPTAVLSNDGPRPVGELVTITFSDVFDPSLTDTDAGFIYSFDLDGDGIFEISGNSSSVTHAFETAGEYVIAGRVADKDGDFSEYTTTVVVENEGGSVAPVFESLIATSPVGEGSTVTLTGTFVDPNDDDTFTLDVNWGDGTIEQFEIVAGERSFQFTHDYADDPQGEDLAGFTIGVTLTDSADLAVATSTTTIVNNVAPVLADVSALPAELGEGDTATISGSILEPGADAITLTIDWGDGSDSEDFDYTAGTLSFSESHVYARSGTFDATLTIVDDDGASSQTQLQITVANAPPTATFGNDGPIDEGGSATISFTDPSDSDADTAAGFMYAFDLDNDGIFEVTTAAASITNVFPSSGTFTVSGRIYDVDGDYTGYTTDVVVNDVAPVIQVAGAAESDEAASFELTLGAVTDPGNDVVMGYTIHWGDGTSQTFSGSPVGAVRSHVFSDGPASRTIRIDLMDGDGTHADAATIAVAVNNVVPTAVFAGTGANEGSAASIGFTNQSDPSAQDAAAGFTYSFDLNNDGDFDDAGEVADTNQPNWTATFPDNGVYTVRGRIKDKDGGFSDYTTTLTITNAAPSASIIGAPATATEGSLISLSSLVVDAGALDTFSYAWTVTRNGQPFATGTDADFEFTPSDEGAYVVSLQVTDDDGGIGNAIAKTIAVQNAAPVLVASSTTASAQYSDPIAPVLFSASDAGNDVLSAATSFSTNGGSTFTAGLPAGLTLTPRSAGQWTLGGAANVAPGSYLIRVTVSDGDGGTVSGNVTLTVTAEDASVNYTGTMLATTLSNKSGKATLILATTVRDSSLTDLSDAFAGDVRNAKVTFYVYNAMTDALVTTISNVAVGLVNPGDPRTGTAAYEWAIDIGNADSAIYRVVTMAGSRYVGESAGDFVTVAKPLNGAINGSAYIVNTASAGLLAGDAGQRTDIAYSVLSTKSGAKGSVVMRVRRMESDGILHTYQIKSNAILTVTTNPVTGAAVFEAKAAIQDITFTGRPISIDGNALLRITVIDGRSGATDRMGATLWRKDGGLYFSSLWDGVRTLEDELDGGDIKVS